MGDEKKVVGIEYQVDTHGAEPNVQRLKGALHGAGEEAHRLREKFGEFRRESNLTIPALLGVGVGLAGIIEKAKESTAEFNRAQKQITGVYASFLKWDKGQTVIDRYQRSTKLARETTEALDTVSSRFGTSLQDVGDAYKTVAISSAPLKLSQAQVLKLTTQSAAAAKVFGISGSDAANKIGTILTTRTIRATDDFGKAMKNALGNIKKLSQPQLLERVTKAMKDFEQIGDQMSQGFGDNLNRVQSVFGGFLRELGSPVLAEASRWLGQLAKHMKEAGESGRPRIMEYAETLVSAFKTFERISEFILKHWKEIAAVWAAAKLPGAAKSVAELAGGAAGGLRGLAARGGFMIGAYGVSKAMENTAADEQRRDLGASLNGVLYNFRQGRKAGGVDERAAYYDEAIKSLRALNVDPGDSKARNAYFSQVTDAAQKTGLPQSALVEMTNNLAKFGAMLDRLGIGRGEDDPDKKRRFIAPQMNINHLEVKMNFEDVDPERVMVRFQDELHSLAQRRNQSASMHPDIE